MLHHYAISCSELMIPITQNKAKAEAEKVAGLANEATGIAADKANEVTQ